MADVLRLVNITPPNWATPPQHHWVLQKLQVESVRDAGYAIRKMAERCGMTVHTLRYYERVGLIQPVGRARNGHRRYSDADEAWLNFLNCMRATNMSIREMQRYARLREQGETTALEHRKLLEDHQKQIASKISALQKAHSLLTREIAGYGLVKERTRIDASHDGNGEIATAS